MFEDNIRKQRVEVVTSQRVQINITSSRSLVQYFQPVSDVRDVLGMEMDSSLLFTPCRVGPTSCERDLSAPIVEMGEWDDYGFARSRQALSPQREDFLARFPAGKKAERALAMQAKVVVCISMHTLVSGRF